MNDVNAEKPVSAGENAGVITLDTGERTDGKRTTITMKPGGEFIIDGRLVATDREVYEGFAKFITQMGPLESVTALKAQLEAANARADEYERRFKMGLANPGSTLGQPRTGARNR